MNQITLTKIEAKITSIIWRLSHIKRIAFGGAKKMRLENKKAGSWQDAGGKGKESFYDKCTNKDDTCQTENIIINYSFLKHVLKRQEPLKNLRLYLIAKQRFNRKSGLFSLDELIEILSRDMKSVNHKSGNQRNRYKRQLENRLSNSILFRSAPDGRYLINGNRQFQFRKNKKITLFNSNLLTSRGFLDGIIAGIITSRPFAGINEIAKILNTSDRRVSQAIEKLIKDKRIIKIQNLIIPELKNVHGDLTKIQDFRRDLYNQHGIITPEPIIFKRVRYLALFWKNSFFSIVDESQKAARHLTFSKKFPLTLITDTPKNYRLFEFNNNFYSFTDYLSNFGFQNLR